MQLLPNRSFSCHLTSPNSQTHTSTEHEGPGRPFRGRRRRVRDRAERRWGHRRDVARRCRGEIQVAANARSPVVHAEKVHAYTRLVRSWLQRGPIFPMGPSPDSSRRSHRRWMLGALRTKALPQSALARSLSGPQLRHSLSPTARIRMSELERLPLTLTGRPHSPPLFPRRVFE